jgi:hypothetical protein
MAALLGFAAIKISPIFAFRKIKFQKENDGGMNSSMIYLYIVRTFVNATMYPQHNNKNKMFHDKVVFH